MEQNKTYLEQFNTTLKEHSLSINEVENHQILSLNNPNILFEVNNLINRLAQIEKQQIIEDIESLFIIMNRLKIYEFTSFLNLIDDNFPALSCYFVMYARQLNEYNENKFFLNRLIKLNAVNKLYLLFSPNRTRLITALVDKTDQFEDCELEVIDEVFLLSLIRKSLTKNDSGKNLQFSQAESELLTSEERRIAYVKGVMSKLRHQLIVN